MVEGWKGWGAAERERETPRETDSAEAGRERWQSGQRAVCIRVRA